MEKHPSLPGFLLAGLLVARPHFSGAAYPFTQGFFLLPALVGLALVLMAPATERLPSKKNIQLILALPWILCCWSFLSLIWAVDLGKGVEVNFSLLLAVAVFTLTFFIARDWKGEDRSWAVLLSLLLLPVLFRAFYQHFFGMYRLQRVLEEMQAGGQQVRDLMGIISRGRVFASFLNSNMLAGFLAIFIPFTLDLALTSLNKGRRFLFSLLLVGQVCVLLLTGSVGGSLAAAAGATLVFLVRKRISRRGFFWMIAIGMIMIAGLVMVRGFSGLSGPDNSILQRLGYWKAGFLMAAEKPFFGWGAGSTPGTLMGYVAPGVRPVTDPHNFLVGSWVAWGLPGLAFLVSFLLLWVRYVLGPVSGKGWRSLPGGYAGLFFGGVAFFLHSLMDMDFFVPETSLFFWVVVAGSLGMAARESGDPGRKSPWFGKGVRWSLAGAALALVLPALIFLQGEFTVFKGDRAVGEGQFEEAASLYRSARGLFPLNGNLTLEEGRARRAMGQREEAAALFEEASMQLRASPYPSWELGRIELSKGNWEGALPYLQKALERFPTSPRILIDLAQAHHGMGDRTEAIRFLEEARRCAVFDGEARRFLQGSP